MVFRLCHVSFCSGENPLLSITHPREKRSVVQGLRVKLLSPFEMGLNESVHDVPHPIRLLRGYVDSFPSFCVTTAWVVVDVPPECFALRLLFLYITFFSFFVLLKYSDWVAASAVFLFIYSETPQIRTNWGCACSD